MTTLLILAATMGQYRNCQTAQSYALQYRTTYAQPYQAYATNYATYAQPYLEVKFAPVIHEYAGLVGGEARARNRREEELNSRAELATRIDRLSGSVDKLAASFAAGIQPPPVVVQPPPVAPGKPTPDVPGKPTPDVAPQPPPTPKVNPGDNGEVPPPPPVPSVPNPNAAIVPPDAQTLAILTKNCAVCHKTPAKAGKGLVLFNEAGEFTSKDPLMLLQIDQEVYSGAMPKNKDPLSAEDYSRLRAWINNSQPQIEIALKNCKTKATQ